MNNRENLGAQHFDALREIGNIGSGHVATSLSQLLSRPIDMSIPTVKVR